MIPAIKAEGLGKRYVIGGAAEANQTFREMLVQRVSSPARWLRRWTGKEEGGAPSREEFWALKNVSFEVQQGEVVGIIGRNGAGKSTLLKILSRITEPTEGRAEIRGRVASLLEVGTGFHPELTGHENIYLNGAILGMTHQEISRKFDEIVAFAEVEKFIDTPVKHYSSGMYVRLAFAVAAHLEPEILIVDEVLAVGDAAFQKKCLGKMGDVAKEGRTVLFVSHNMGAVRKLCSRAILLAKGSVMMDGAPGDVISTYLDDGTEAAKRIKFSSQNHKAAWIASVEFVDSSVSQNEYHELKIQYCLRKRLTRYRLGVEILNVEGDIVMVAFSSDGGEFYSDDAGSYQVGMKCPASLLLPGAYYVRAFIGQPGIIRHDETNSLLKINIVGNCEPRSGVIGTISEWVRERR